VRERYLDHALLSHFARPLIWQFVDGPAARTGTWFNGQLVDSRGQALGKLGENTSVRLWHPLGATPAQVLEWRLWLEEHEVRQPFKQAHREIYPLTDAELGTRTYSNRFAGHILRQHQMHALAEQRGWKAPLALVYDGAWEATLSLELPGGLRAEYFVTGALDDANREASYSANGVYLYVSTDQVRFIRMDANRQSGPGGHSAPGVLRSHA
jgi:hypothetical protein